MRSVLSLLLVLMSCSASAVEPPVGWRVPTEAELASQPLRNNSPMKNAEVVGDLNDDGKIDRAYLFKSTEYSGEGLLVSLSSPSGYVWKVLARIDWGEEYPNVDLAMGIDLVEPGNHKTACGNDGCCECDPDDPEILMLNSPGILYFRFGGGASIWYWDESKHRFNAVAESD